MQPVLQTRLLSNPSDTPTLTPQPYMEMEEDEHTRNNIHLAPPDTLAFDWFPPKPRPQPFPSHQLDPPIPSPKPYNSLYEGAAGHTQEVGRTHGHGRGRRGAAPVHLHVVPQVGPGGEALVTLLAREGLLLGVDPPVADELGRDAEGLAAVGALVALGLRVDATVVLQGHEVGELLLAGVAEVGARLVAVLVVEQ